MSSTKHRLSNIELLRIILIIMVIFLHFSNKDMGGGLSYVVYNNLNECIVRFLQAISICAVDTFIIITGFFMCEKKEIDIKKPIFLLISVILYQIITYILLVFFSFEQFTFTSILIKLVPLNWYIMLYNVLYILIPLANKILVKFNINKNKMYLFLLLIIFSVYPSIVDIIGGVFNIGDIPGLSTISILGNEHGYTIINFLLLYFIGAIIKKIGYSNKIIPVLLFFVSSFIITAISFFTEAVWNYNNIFVITNAICIFIIFLNIHVRYNKIINYFSKGVLGVYIIHPYLIGHVTKYIPLINIGKISVLELISKIILFIVIVFMLSFIIYLLGNIFDKYIKRIISKTINYLEINTEIRIK